MAQVICTGYTGAYCDGVASSYPFGDGYRRFIPSLMRFTAADDWSPFGPAGIHCYGYCAGDPINGKDPSGHLSISDITSWLRGWAAQDPVHVDTIETAHAGEIALKTHETRAVIYAEHDISEIRHAASDVADEYHVPEPIMQGNASAHSASLRELVVGSSSLERLPVPAMEKIVSHLSGKDLTNLSAASFTMFEKVQYNLIDLDKFFSNVDKKYRLGKIWSVMEGRSQGVMPSQLYDVPGFFPENYPIVRTNLPFVDAIADVRRLGAIRRFYENMPPDARLLRWLVGWSEAY